MKKIISIITTSLLMLFVFVPPSFAKVMIQETGLQVVSSDETINDDLFIAGESVEINGTVNGDVYIGAGLVRVDGVINGDLFIGAGNVTVGGKIKDDVYIGGGNVTVQGASIGDSLLVGAGTLMIDRDSSIGGSLLAGVGNLTNRANVKRNMFVGGGMIDFDSKVGGEARFGGGDIRLGDNASVEGDLYYMLGENGKETLNVSEGKVKGSINKVETPANMMPEVEKAKTDFSGIARGLLLVSFLGALLVGVLAVKTLPKVIPDLVSQSKKDWLGNLGVGLLVLILTVPASVLLMFTGVGASLAFIILALFGVAVYFAKIVSSLVLGSVLSDQFGWKKVNVYGNLIIGLVILFLLKSVPVVGAITTLLFTSMGLGAIYRLLKK